MRKFLSLIVAVSLAFIGANAQSTDVSFKYDSSSVKASVVNTAETNINKLLTGINTAFEYGGQPDLSSVGMTAEARKIVSVLWQNVRFHTAQNTITDRLWVFKGNGLMQVGHIPLILDDDEGLISNENQDAVVEFDLTGRITDFRLAVDAQTGESFENVGDVATLEQQAIIMKWLERFRTAYNKKDIDFLNMIFSDDALIITGNVVKTRSSEFGVSEKVNYTRQTKVQYLRNLRRCFARNKSIQVDFRTIDNAANGKSRYITRRESNGHTYYGVRVHQTWRSTNYSDEGYLFLLWEFNDGEDPIIHVRTWQPEKVNGKQIPLDEIFSITDFVRE